MSAFYSDMTADFPKELCLIQHPELPVQPLRTTLNQHSLMDSQDFFIKLVIKASKRSKEKKQQSNVDGFIITKQLSFEKGRLILYPSYRSELKYWFI